MSKRCGSCAHFVKWPGGRGLCEKKDWNTTADTAACKDDYKGKRYKGGKNV